MNRVLRNRMNWTLSVMWYFVGHTTAVSTLPRLNGFECEWMCGGGRSSRKAWIGSRHGCLQPHSWTCELSLALCTKQSQQTVLKVYVDPVNFKDILQKAGCKISSRSWTAATSEPRWALCTPACAPAAQPSPSRNNTSTCISVMFSFVYFFISFSCCNVIIKESW